MWDEKAAARYDQWYSSPSGAFALGREIRLLERMTSGWPRRGQKLLEIGCGTGVFLQVLHRAGFDVTGLDRSPAMLESARERMGDRADLHLGDAAHLPFDDNEFDFSVLFTVLEFCADPGLVLREAARVSRKAILVGFLNKYSLYWLTMFCWPGRRGGVLKKAHWFSPGEMRRLIACNLGRKAYKRRSVLPGPVFTWRNIPPWKQLNKFVWPIPVGAYCAGRIGLLDEPPKTPLYVWKTKPETG